MLLAVYSTLRRMMMSKKTVSQMEAALMDRIEKAKNELLKLQQKHKLEIGSLAYKHGLNLWDMARLEHAFAQLAREAPHGNQ
jgi:hypothetical protein